MVLVAHIKLCVTAKRFRKNPKMVKNGTKTGFLEFLRKSHHQFCLEFFVKRKFFRFINIFGKLHAWEKSGPQVVAKNGSSWPMRFQYSLIVNISLIDEYLTLIFGM